MLNDRIDALAAYLSRIQEIRERREEYKRTAIALSKEHCPVYYMERECSDCALNIRLAVMTRVRKDTGSTCP
jgi:predicted ArsR family transcriptional regulator